MLKYRLIAADEAPPVPPKLTPLGQEVAAMLGALGQGKVAAVELPPGKVAGATKRAIRATAKKLGKTIVLYEVEGVCYVRLDTKAEAPKPATNGSREVVQRPVEKCPKCGGNLLPSREMDGVDWSCLQCGKRLDSEPLPPLEPLPGRQRRREPTHAGSRL